MPQYLAPGVYVEEIAGPKPIEPVGTATGGFVGIAERGPIGKATLVTSWTQFIDTFGGYLQSGYLAYAVSHFFAEGGNKCYVVRTCHYSDITDRESKKAKLATVTLKDRAASPVETLRVDAKNEGTWGNELGILIEDASKDKDSKFKLVVLRKGKEVETHDLLSIQDVEEKTRDSKYISVKNLNAGTRVPNNRPGLSETKKIGGVEVRPLGKDLAINARVTENTFDFEIQQAGVAKESFDKMTLATVERRVNSLSTLIRVVAVDSRTMPTDTTVDLPFSALEGGDDGSKGLTDSDYIGDGGARNGLYAFDVIDDVNILAIPDAAGDREVTIAAYTYCQNRKDCFFVADPPNNNISVQDILAYKLGTGLYQGNAFNSSYAALYYPWIEVIDPASETGMTRKVPPSGAVIGTYSYTDTLRGVHKAPAGINEGYLNSAVGIVTEVTHGQQELLNPEGINVIRSLPGAGICIWGARTLSADSEWKYVNVRRLLLFIEESIEEGTQWVVFEPNDRSLWGKVRRDTTAFLSTVWQSGALFGATQQEAFFVKIDDENNPPEMRDLGRLVIDVGVRPVKPAEFVIFRITQMVQGKKA